MPSIATRAFVAVIGTCLGAVLIAATVASLITAGVHVWHQLLKVYTWHQAMQLTSGVTGFITVLVLIAGMFGYAHWKADDELGPGETEAEQPPETADPTTE